MKGLYPSWIKMVVGALLVREIRDRISRATQRLESKFAVWGNQGDLNVAEVQVGAAEQGEEIEKVVE